MQLDNNQQFIYLWVRPCVILIFFSTIAFDFDTCTHKLTINLRAFTKMFSKKDRPQVREMRNNCGVGRTEWICQHPKN